LDVDSDKLLGMDARLRLDRLGGITLLGEFLIDDFDVHRLRYFFTEEGSQTFAVIVPALGTPLFSARLTAKHMGPITYTHAALTVRGGGERIRNAGFLGGRRWDYQAQVGLRLLQ